MKQGTFAGPRRRLAARGPRRGHKRGLVAAAVLACAVVIVLGALIVLGVIPSAASRQGAAPLHGSRETHSSRKPERPPPLRPPVGTIGRYQVSSTSMVFTDRSRPGLGARMLPTLVRYPVVPAGAVASGRLAPGPFPLVVFAPGYLQCRSSYAALLHAWASAGYVVAAVQFPRTHCYVADPDEADLSNQPADVSVVITRLLALSARPAGVLSGRIDPARIAVAGHSDGGDTAAAVAANSCCRDRRVIAALILSGAEWPPLGGRYFHPGSPPILFVQGTDDTWNPPPASAQLYQNDTTGIRYYLDLLGANHFAPYEGHTPPEPLVARVTVDFLNTYLDGQPAQLSKLTADGNVPGVAVLLRNGRLPQ